jgi:hypothetical protein
MAKRVPSLRDEVLLDFLVALSVDEDFRHKFHDPAQRETIMAAAGLSDRAKAALRSKSKKEVITTLDNTQAASALIMERPARGRKKPKKASRPKPKSKSKRKASKRAARKTRR